MASQAAVASGADYEQARRRNVPSTPTSQAKRVEVDDKKKQAKVSG